MKSEMPSSMFRPLSPDELKKFRQWARDNYILGTEINSLWHPSIRVECELMNLEEVQQQYPKFREGVQNPRTFSMEELKEAMESQSGFCLKCGAERGECEPDARKYKCESCGANAVYGAEEIVIMGLVSEEGEEE
jgi:hypothetical protein